MNPPPLGCCLQLTVNLSQQCDIVTNQYLLLTSMIVGLASTQTPLCSSTADSSPRCPTVAFRIRHTKDQVSHYVNTSNTELCRPCSAGANPTSRIIELTTRERLDALGELGVVTQRPVSYLPHEQLAHSTYLVPRTFTNSSFDLVA